MEKYELPLVIFTVLSQMSVGITLILTLRTLQGKLESKRLYWLITGLVLAAASVAAILHLAHPDRAYNALINLQHAWLSREILGATLYGAAVGVTFLAKGHKVPAVLASVLGIALVAVQGMTYAAPAMVAIANGLTMLLFFITVWVMGCAAIPLLNLAPAIAPGDCRLYGGHDRSPNYLVKRRHHYADDRACLADLAALSGEPGLSGAGLCIKSSGRTSGKSAVCPAVCWRIPQSSDVLWRYGQHHREYRSFVLIAP